MTRIFIKPTPQKDDQPPLKVRKPTNGHLAADGEYVTQESYWLRRIADGDVVIDEKAPTEQEAAERAAAAAAAAASSAATGDASQTAAAKTVTKK